jgi:methionyl-tRNA formyltransferase
VLEDLPAHQGSSSKQDSSLATYANKILKPEAEINWQLNARLLDRRIRAFNPFPVCFTMLGGERVKIWQARPASSVAVPEAPGTILRADSQGILVNCGDGQLSIERLQLPGGKPLTAQQMLNSRCELFAPGHCFTAPAASLS